MEGVFFVARHFLFTHLANFGGKAPKRITNYSGEVCYLALPTMLARLNISYVLTHSALYRFALFVHICSDHLYGYPVLYVIILSDGWWVKMDAMSPMQSQTWILCVYSALRINIVVCIDGFLIINFILWPMYDFESASRIVQFHDVPVCLWGLKEHLFIVDGFHNHNL